MRIFILLFLLNTALHAQQNLFPRTFVKTPGVKQVIVRRDCAACQPKEIKKHIQTYHFDEKGYNVSENGIDKGQKSGEQKYFWNADGTINYYENWNTIGYSGDTEENMVGVWCKDCLSDEVRYEYKKGVLVKASVFTENEKKLEFDVTYEYNATGKLLKEKSTSYPGDGINISFKPNSTETVESADLNATTSYEKNYSYRNDSIFIQYISNGKLSGRGVKKVRNDAQTIVETTYDLTGKIIYKESNTYNLKGQITQCKLLETGYDGFGNAYDYIGADLTTYTYDASGKLITKTEYYAGKVWIVENYTYIK